MASNLIQISVNGKPQAAIVKNSDTIAPLAAELSVLELAQRAIDENSSISALVESIGTGEEISYQSALDNGQVLPPLVHSDPAHVLVAGTGLTHLGSAATRDAMHAKTENTENLTDSMKMFKMGLDGGKPAEGEVGVQPEWFYKGDGDTVVAPGGELDQPFYALDGGEEPEIAGIYLVGQDGVPYRIGFALGNEFSDHVMERQNYLYLAHSKVRRSAIGPEILLGDLPRSIEGSSRIKRNGEVIWEKPFLSGEENMSHTIANLEYHHFKYVDFLRPGDVHIHFFGTATLSFGDGVEPQDGDQFEIEAAPFGRPLQNTLKKSEHEVPAAKAL